MHLDDNVFWGWPYCLTLPIVRVFEAVRYVAQAMGETGEITRLPTDAIHPVWRAGSVVIRLEVAETSREVAVRVDNCRRLCAAGVPFVVPVAAEPLPVPGWEGLVATTWEYVEPIEPIDWTALGQAVRAFHKFDGLVVPPSAPLPERLARAVDNHAALAPKVADRFRSMVPVFEAVIEDSAWHELPVVATHGDLWIKNVIPRGAGRVMMCDPDFFGLRPAAADLGVVHHQIGADERWDRFVEGYEPGEMPSVELLNAGLRLTILNWTIYVLERRPEWVAYTEQLSLGKA